MMNIDNRSLSNSEGIHLAFKITAKPTGAATKILLGVASYRALCKNLGNLAPSDKIDFALKMYTDDSVHLVAISLDYSVPLRTAVLYRNDLRIANVALSE
jgi:hypothetical protein